MRNIIGQAVVGEDLYGRAYEMRRLWELLEQGQHILMLAPRRVGKTSLMLGGSIGLEGVLRRAGLSGLINDFTPFRLESWDRVTATDFLREVGRDSGFPLDQDSIIQILERLRDPVPYHVQLFFGSLRDACQGESGRMSPDVLEQCFVERLAGATGTAHLDHYATRLEIAFDPAEHAIARNVLSLACNRGGVELTHLQDLSQRNETAFQSVLRDLQSDGYLNREGDRLVFQSNLLREWWGKHHASGVAP